MTGQSSAQEFCEECENRTKLVRREPELASNASLPAAFERATGERIYDGLRNGFRVPTSLTPCGLARDSCPAASSCPHFARHSVKGMQLQICSGT